MSRSNSVTRNRSRSASRNSSRRNSLFVEEEEPFPLNEQWFDANDDDSDWPESIERLFHNLNAGINISLKKSISDKEKDAARSLLKKTTGAEAAHQTIQKIRNQMEKENFMMQKRIEQLIAPKSLKENIPSFNFSTKENCIDFNNILKRIDRIFDTKITLQSDNLASFLKFLVHLQIHHQLSEYDVIEILHCKLDNQDFEILENQIEANGFQAAFENLCDNFVRKESQTDKTIKFHQYRLDFLITLTN